MQHSMSRKIVKTMAQQMRNIIKSTGGPMKYYCATFFLVRQCKVGLKSGIL